MMNGGILFTFFFCYFATTFEEVTAFHTAPSLSSPVSTSSSFVTRRRTVTQTNTKTTIAPLTIKFYKNDLTSTKASMNDITDVATIINNASSSPTSSSLSSPNIQGLSPTTNTLVFIIGIIPFLWATYEFWSRIAVGKSFGTGTDSIQIRPSPGSNLGRTIGKDGDPLKSRGQQVLGDDALLVAYVLFA
eukprot:CAMPEP_0176496594 /NCGR_PEP_ID=MMETSP0200_2-20121128/11275_1 /TAXON_ID=947934 /ORGANISM="Chaetoceros sp., Strain GSL56" /LENGTH=188 /DNA_ID=CAMNT_0017894553 /DNA_START=66 /DNA_END=629 /DNA_ORIENTATION=+